MEGRPFKERGTKGERKGEKAAARSQGVTGIGNSFEGKDLRIV